MTNGRYRVDYRADGTGYLSQVSPTTQRVWRQDSAPVTPTQKPGLDDCGNPVAARSDDAAAAIVKRVMALDPKLAAELAALLKRRGVQGDSRSPSTRMADAQAAYLARLAKRPAPDRYDSRSPKTRMEDAQAAYLSRLAGAHGAHKSRAR